jgi:hypothetical protein
MKLDKDFNEFVELFVANDVRFLVVGGYALAAHGYPRATDDFDAWVWANPENAVKIVDWLNVPFIGRDDLLKNKRATGRPKDFLDVECLTGN